MNGDQVGIQSRLKPTVSTSSSGGESEPEELELIERAPPFWKNSKKKLSKQLSMCETPRDKAWERRRRQMLHQERRRNGSQDDVVSSGGAAAAAELDLTDEDLNELKGSIELGFGFNEQQGQGLCNTLPALDLYFAVNRHFSPPSPALVSPSNNNRQLSSSSRSSSSKSLGQRSSSFGSDKILTPGDAPEQVKTKLRHWAQAVACSVMQSH